MPPSHSHRSRWSQAGDLAIEVPAVIVTFVMMVHVTLNAVLRRYFGSPIDYTLEITQYWYMPILAFLGFMAAQRRGQHIAADLIFQMLPTVSRRFVLASFYLVAAVLVAALAKFGLGRHSSPERSVSTRGSPRCLPGSPTTSRPSPSAS
ncbi:TRAP transporter small permease [Nocardioides alcanivorans]|uniref:TRAP transporter small permease n=1 Tax=Nocardioides alcanivorans TaxID=2897352 RepID=UPI001F2551D8|nr:TRAP transporter small permease [Nocardioides alcanivorans]